MEEGRRSAVAKACVTGGGLKRRWAWKTWRRGEGEGSGDGMRVEEGLEATGGKEG